MADRSSIIERLKSKVTTADEFNYDKLTAPPLSCLLSQYDIDRLYNIATSVRYSGNIEKKMKAMNEVLNPRGFIKFAAGTNRICYRFVDSSDFVIKAAFDSVAIHDSPAEFNNQFIIKPFCTKVFEVDPCGVVGSFERVDPIRSREEFMSVADDAYDLIYNWLMGNGHIMADVGTKYFMNYGIRRGFGLVITDFPYLYEIDGNKLYCNAPNSNSPTGVCGGLIDCDAGCNELHCELCGARYRFKQIAKEIKNERIIVKGGTGKMNGAKRKPKVKITVKGAPINIGNEANDLLAKAESSTSSAQVTRPASNSNDCNSGRAKISSHTVSTKPQQQSKPSAKIDERPRQVPPQRNDYRGKTSAKVSTSPQVVDQPGISAGSNTVSSVATERVTPANQMASIAVKEGYTMPSNSANDDNVIKENEQQRITIENQKRQLEELTRELEVCKQDLNSAEEQKAVVDQEWLKMQNSYAELERQAKADKDLAAARKNKIEELEKNGQQYLDNLATLKESIGKYKDKINSLEVDLENKNAEFLGLKEEVSAKDAVIKELNETIVALNTKLEDKKIDSVDSDALEYENEDLKREIGELKAEIEELSKAEHEEGTDESAEDMESKRKIEELSNTIKEMGRDVSDFIDLTMALNDVILRPEMAAEEGFVAEQIQDVEAATLDGTICALSDVFEDIEETVDRAVMIFKNADGSCLSTSDGRVIMLTSIGSVPLDSLVCENALVFADQAIREKYFEELTEEEMEAAEEEEADDTAAESRED